MFSETYTEGGKKEVKPATPYAIAVFHLLGKNDKNDDGSPMFFTKGFPLKKGDKSFLHKTFIPAFGGFTKHKGFSTMTNQLVSLTLKGSKAQGDDGTPKYINFGAVAEIGEDTLELLEAAPAYAALPDAPGFLLEGELTKEVIELMNPYTDVLNCICETEEFKAGTHPSQAVIQAVIDANPERYTRKAKGDDKQSDEADGQSDDNSPQTGNAVAEELDEEATY
ncbi:hypothetical protein [Aeromonas phage MJG]|uniref:Uncharacterized protein n=1 Tax=Aeromonas phage MJG TaxID=2510451 RepID=A0A5J6A2H0_9CAUD|nr:hypothetical protein [Aeromonas phage MJG]